MRVGLGYKRTTLIACFLLHSKMKSLVEKMKLFPRKKNEKKFQSAGKNKEVFM